MSRLFAPVIVGAWLLLACGGDTVDATATPTPIRPAPTTTVVPPTPPGAATVTPTFTAALEALLAPGPTQPAPAQFFFLDDDDLWRVPADGPPARVTEGLRIDAVAQTPDGTRAAIVVRHQDAAAGQEIRLVDAAGTVSDTVFGPVPASPGQDITALAWSWDGSALAVGYADGTLSVLGFTLGQPTESRVAGTTPGLPVTAITWAPNGAGKALLQLHPDGPQALVAPTGEPARPLAGSVPASARPVAACAWLPGRGRIAVVEGQGATPSALTGSILTITPDGSAPELLVSAGQFAPAAQVRALFPSPDGRELAFTVFQPSAGGKLQFASLQLLTIDTGELLEVPVEPGYWVTDVWWTASGVVWRGIDASSVTTGDGTTYTGREPFILTRYDPTTRGSTVLYPLPGAGAE